MLISPIPENERERLRALRDLEILDTPRERAFDGLVEAAAIVCDVPISAISLVDHARQWFKASVGLPGVTETPRDIAFCAHAILEDGIFEVPDATLDARFVHNPLVTADPSIRFYAGAPLALSDGTKVGTLCVIDRAPRTLSSEQRQVLSHLAAAAVSALESRCNARRLAESEARFRALTEAAADAIVSIDEDDRIVLFNAAAERMFQCDGASAMGRPISEFVPAGFLHEAPTSTEHANTGRAHASDTSHLRLIGRRRDGSEFPIEPAVSRVCVDGRTLRTAIVRDVTHRFELETRAAQRAFDLAAANAQLRLTSDQLRAAQRITHVGSWEFDVSSGDVRWSDELFRIAGLAPTECVPSFPAQAQLYVAESWHRLSEAVSNCLASGTPYELELELVRPDGQRRLTIARGEAGRQGPGGVEFMFGTLQDVTELKRAGEKAQRASERSQLATRAAGMGVWEWDVARDTVIWDETMQQLWGQGDACAELPLPRWVDMVHVADQPEMRGQLAHALEHANDLELFVRVLQPDGQLRHMRATATVRRASDGCPRTWVGVSWDVTEQHRAQAALRASKLLLKEFVRHAPAAIAMFDREMRYLHASERWAIQLAHPVAALLGKTHYDVVPDTPEHWKAMHRRVLAGEALRSDEDAVPEADGSTTWFEWDAHPWHEPDGRIGGLTWYMKDVTDKKRLELALRDQTAALERSQAERERAHTRLQEMLTFQHAILDSAGMSIIATDAHGKIDTFNRAAQRMLGYSEAEMLGNTPAAFHAFEEVVARSVELETELGEVVTPGFDVFVAKARRGEAEQREWTYVRKGGSHVPVLLSVTALRAPDGAIFGFLGVAADLSEQRRAQSLLEQVSSRLRIATAGAGVGIWEWNLESNALAWDDQMCRLYGVEAPNSSAHETWEASLHPDDSVRAKREISEAARGLGPFDSTFRVNHQDGTVRFIRAHGILEVGPAGGPLRMIGTNWDVTKECEAERALAAQITALKEMELRLRRKQAELERSNEELQQFAYVASHDLQEPLRAVAGCAQVLSASYTGRLDSDADELIRHMIDGATRMRALIHDLLALSRVNANPSVYKPVDLNAACTAALTNLAEALRTSEAVVKVDTLPSTVGDERQFVQLFQNLLGNALKYRSATRPAIHVGCETTETEHIYFVADNGIGIEPQYFERIFGVFQRLHTRTEYEGTGIGLAICNKVIKRHHGKIWLESRVGHGTTFRFSVPRQQRRLSA